MQPWIPIAVVVLLILGLVVARGRVQWRVGALLVALAVGSVALVEALVRAQVLSRESSGSLIAAIAIAMVLLASVISRRRAS